MTRTLDADAFLEWLAERFGAEFLSDGYRSAMYQVRAHVLSLCPDQPEGPK